LTLARGHASIADFNASRVDAAIRYGREHSAGLKFEPLVR
jgi:LysR family glycine cleavage system transcriptional activator